MEFKLTSKYEPTGDQPEAIRELTDGIRQGDQAQVLLGVTGSGKTFTVANVIQQVQVPTLVLSHNKTLAAQLYEEMKAFFPENAVEYYVSYYDYYQPSLPEWTWPSFQRQIVKDFLIKFTKNLQKRCQKHCMAPDTSFDRLHFSVQQVFAEIRIVWQLVDIWLPAPLDFGQFQRIGCLQCMIVARHI